MKYWIDTLIGVDVDKIFINVYWLREKIRAYVNALNENIKSRVLLYEETHLEPVGAVLFKLNCLLGEAFLIVNSDTYIERSEVSRFIKVAKIDRQTPICLAVEKRENIKEKGMVIFSNGQKKIEDFVEKPEGDRSGYAWAGMALMSREVISSYKIEELIRKELSHDIFPDFKNRMIGLEVKEAVDIGESIDSYRKARQRFGRG